MNIIIKINGPNLSHFILTCSMWIGGVGCLLLLGSAFCLLASLVHVVFFSGPDYLPKAGALCIIAYKIGIPGGVALWFGITGIRTSFSLIE